MPQGDSIEWKQATERQPMNHHIARVLIVLGLIAAMVTPITAAVADDTDTDVYVVVMSDDPIITYEGDVAGYAATKPAKGEKVDQNDRKVVKYEDYLENEQDEILSEVGASSDAKIQSYTFALSGFAAQLTEDQAAELQRSSKVALIKRDELRQPLTDNSGTFLGLTAAGSAYDAGYTGEGVIIGVIDTGIWPEHPSFSDDGSYTPPPSYWMGGTIACEFGGTGGSLVDNPFTCNNKLIGARDMRVNYNFFIGPEQYDSARDANGHGTHTASTAGGNADVPASIFGVDRGDVTGIAPRAYIAMYKACGELGCFGSDLAGAIDQAVADGVDVINYSIGGGPSLTGADDIAFLFAADANVWVATSAGNSGPGAGTVGGPGSVPWLTTVGASTQDRTFEGTATLGNGLSYAGASITAGVGPATLVDSADAGSELCYPGALDPAVVSGNIVLCKRGAIARVSKSEAVSIAGGVGMILYNASDAQSQVTDNHWVPSVHINNTDGLAIKAYIASAGASATATITGGVFTRIPGSSMASFSSRGPDTVATDIIKPDITAPGVNILAGNTPTSSSGFPGQLFQSISGTSMSSPHVAGMFALLRQAHPDWSAAMAKSAIMTTARQDVTKEDGVTPADPFDMGAGHLNPLGTQWEDYADDSDHDSDHDNGKDDDKRHDKDKKDEKGKKKDKDKDDVDIDDEGTAFNPGLVYDAGFLDYLGFLCGTDEGIVSAGTCSYLESVGIPSDASDLNYPSIGIGALAGVQTITRTVTNVSDEQIKVKAKVKAPAGYTVTVSPKKLKVPAGGQATFTVTISNDGSAPIGAWRYGSLTWKGDDYEVRSPIAVRGVAFDGPDAVSGTGTSGAASFNVKFGYTGPYTAAPHGLSAKVDNPGTVAQDPDQTFDPSDVDTGGAVAHTFTVTEAVYVRWELFLPTQDDLDVFVYDSGGLEVASSTNGGTDELVEMILPGDDTYTVYVHGWAVTTGTVDYNLESWIVPLTGAGSLNVDAAPTSATIATTGTIDISWSGLTAGEVYYGVVSHSDASGLLGLTLVDVTG